jgi:hypothetical protein
MTLQRLNTFLAVVVLFGGTLSGFAQEKPAADDVASTTTQMTALRDQFTQAASRAGEPCRIATPKLVIADVPSFGSYDPDTNILTVSAWTLLTAEERELFLRGAGRSATEEQARADFEMGVHHWVVVHELGHWWQACRGVMESKDHYGVESGANRIAAAWWQEHDPDVIAHQRAVFGAILERWPNPVPPGQSAETYFNENYKSLGPKRAYIWFQARMCMDAFNEKPTPTFAQALAQTKP